MSLPYIYFAAVGAQHVHFVRSFLSNLKDVGDLLRAYTFKAAYTSNVGNQIKSSFTLKRIARKNLVLKATWSSSSWICLRKISPIGIPHVGTFPFGKAKIISFNQAIEFLTNEVFLINPSEGKWFDASMILYRFPSWYCEKIFNRVMMYILKLLRGGPTLISIQH